MGVHVVRSRALFVLPMKAVCAKTSCTGHVGLEAT